MYTCLADFFEILFKLLEGIFCQIADAYKSKCEFKKGSAYHCDFNKVKSRERNLAYLNQNI